MSIPSINNNNEELNSLAKMGTRMEMENGTVINFADVLYLLEKQMPIDEDSRRRITTNVYDPTNPLATTVNALVFSVYVDTLAKFISTRDTIIPYWRTDIDNTPTGICLYMRRTSLASVPSLASIPYFEGGLARTPHPINDVKGSVQVVAKTDICNTTTWAGINGWRLANIKYNVTEKSNDDLLSNIRPALVGYNSSEPVVQLAVVITSPDTNIQATAHVHVDVVELNV